MLKRRPTLTFLAPPAIYPGYPVEGTVVTRALRPLDIDALDVWLGAAERTTTGQGKYEVTQITPRLTLRARLSSRALLAGEQHFVTNFTIPHDCPPSYAGARSSMQYIVSVLVDVPWWPDARASFRLLVLPPPSSPNAKPALMSSNPRGPTADEPHAEVALADTFLVVGGVVEGAVALFNVGFHHYTAITVALVAEELRSLRTSESTELGCYELQLPLSRPSEGEAIPFQLRVPNVQPSARGTHWQLAWFVDVTVRRARGASLRVRTPVEVLPERSTRPASTQPLRLSEHVGSPRILAAWRAVAERTGAHFDGQTLSASVGPVSVVVAREHRGERGVHLTARLGYPHLRLGLDAGRLGSFERYLPGHARVQWPNADHYFSARDLAQATSFARAAVPRDFGYGIADADDECLWLETRDPGFDHGSLEAFLRAACALAARIPAAALALPFPSQATPALRQVFASLAQSLGATVSAADVSVRGTWEGRPVEVATVWSPGGAPVHTRVRLDAEVRPPERFWGRYSSDAVPSQVRGEARVALTEVLARCWELGVEPERLEAILPAPLGAPPLALDALSALGRLEVALHRRDAYR